MKTKQLGKTNLRVSRIGLGTAEIGFVYGLKPGKFPSDKEAEYLLKSAVDMGITYFDTAASYGVAEERIGKSGITKMDGIIVGTKCGQFLERGEKMSEAEIEKRVDKEIKTSLKRLKLDRLPLLQFHGGSRQQVESGLLSGIMQKFIDKGMVQYAGISTRGKESALAVVKNNFFNTIQLAYSILDQRMSKIVLPEAGKRDTGIINRSVFLKGALTPAMKYLPVGTGLLAEHSYKIAEIAKQSEMDLPTLAMRFVLSNNAIATSLVGTNEVKHLKNAKNAAGKAPLPKDILQKLYKFAIDDPNQVDPFRWSV